MSDEVIIKERENEGSGSNVHVQSSQSLHVQLSYGNVHRTQFGKNEPSIATAERTTCKISTRSVFHIQDPPLFHFK